MSPWEDYLKKIYYDPSHPGSYEGAKVLYNIVKKENKYKISHAKIKNWLSNQNAYTVNKAVKRNFERARVVVSGIDDQWDADLASFQPDATENDGFKYLLFVIDIFSRFGWVEPIKDKSSTEIVKAFKKILNGDRKPNRLRTDAATDFTSKGFQKCVTENKIIHFTTHSEKQANYVERFIKTIKSKIFRFMNASNSKRYVDILPYLIDSYNNTWHSGIKSEPSNVNKVNENKLWWQMYWPKNMKKDFREMKRMRKRKRMRKFKQRHVYKFNVGDQVRLSTRRGAFQREYDTRWTGEIFKIHRRFMNQELPMYKIVDWFNEPVKGSMYQAELQKVDYNESDTIKIENILKYKGRGTSKEALIKWKDWPKKFNSWILASQIEDHSASI